MQDSHSNSASGSSCAWHPCIALLPRLARCFIFNRSFRFALRNLNISTSPSSHTTPNLRPTTHSGSIRDITRIECYTEADAHWEKRLERVNRSEEGGKAGSLRLFRRLRDKYYAFHDAIVASYRGYTRFFTGKRLVALAVALIHSRVLCNLDGHSS